MEQGNGHNRSGLAYVSIVNARGCINRTSVAILDKGATSGHVAMLLIVWL